jgi:nucleotide-binding universal stress UspA family protein
MSYKRILVPVDGSATAAKGMAAAIRLAKESRARLMLLHVVEEYPAYSVPEMAIHIGDFLEVMRASGKRTLARIASSARRAGAKPQTTLVENYDGRVAETIADQARRWKADLIVMGTHGRRGVRRALLGSDAELVVRHSPIPVLLVPAAGRARR